MAEADTGQHAERRWPEAGVHRIPYWIYTDAEIYAREQARIFKGPSWNYVGLTAEVPEPGSFRRSFIGDIPVVLTRDSDGGLNVFINKCAHRGVQFCQKQRGTTNEFICPYHQWTYDLTGKLIGVPFRRGLKRQGGMPAAFELDDHHLQRLQVTERNGVVFASFADDLPPLEDYLGESMLGYFDRLFDGRALKVLGYQRQRIPSNWKLMFENIKDPYHASLLHVFSDHLRPVPGRQPERRPAGRNGPAFGADFPQGRAEGDQRHRRDGPLQGRHETQRRQIC